MVRWGRQVFGYVNRCPHDHVTLDWERNQFLDPNGLRLLALLEQVADVLNGIAARAAYQHEQHGERKQPGQKEARQRHVIIGENSQISS